jgi:hypothetical protein
LIKEIAAHLGAPLAWGRPWGQYDGRRVPIPTENGDLDLADALHELAHYAVAPTWRRRRRQFGLGSPGLRPWIPPLVSNQTAAIEERMASALAIHWLWRGGMREQARKTWSFHSWDGARTSFRHALCCAWARYSRLLGSRMQFDSSPRASYGEVIPDYRRQENVGSLPMLLRQGAGGWGRELADHDRGSRQCAWGTADCASVPGG